MSGSAGWWRSSTKASGRGLINKQNKNTTQRQRCEISRRQKGRWSDEREHKSWWVLEHKLEICFLSPVLKTPEGGGCLVSRNTRERDAFLLGRWLKMLQSCVQSILSDWLREEAQGSGWRHEAPRCLRVHLVNLTIHNESRLFWMLLHQVKSVRSHWCVTYPTGCVKFSF